MDFTLSDTHVSSESKPQGAGTLLSPEAEKLYACNLKSRGEHVFSKDYDL